MNVVLELEFPIPKFCS